jgi:hypothetical protein
MINLFLQNDETTEIGKTENEYRGIITENAKTGIINLNDMSYLLTFQNKPSLVNSSKYLELINKINNKRLNELIIELIPNLFLIKIDKLVNNNLLANSLVSSKKNIIKFTLEQKHAIREMLSFISDNSKSAYGLFGYAGTGKTTVLVEFISYLLEQKIIHSVIFTAPTNKAVSVIKSKFRDYLTELYKLIHKNEKDTSFDMMVSDLHDHNITIDFVTIHKLLKFEVDFNVDGNLVFVRNSDNDNSEKYEIIIIDECSMIPLKMLDTLFTEIRAKKQKHNKILKIIFSGDPSQLPPVNEKESFIFNFNVNITEYNKYINNGKEITDNIKKKYEFLKNDINTMPKYLLTKVKRCKLKIVSEVCYQFRLWTNGILPQFKQFKDKTGVNFYKYKKEIKTNTEWFNKCLEYNFKSKNSVILSWTNKQTDEYNQVIRKKLFSKDELKRFEVGDIIIMNDFYNVDNKKSDYLTDEGKFYTSEQLKINGIKIVSKKISDFPESLDKSALKLKEGDYYNGIYKKMLDKINKNTKRQYDCWELNVSKITDNVDDKGNVYLIYVIGDDFEKIYKYDKDFISNSIRQLYFVLSKKMNIKKDQIEKFVIKPVWQKFHKKFIEAFANVNYGYAITCHKGQGSNFYNVFVDVNDIMKNENDTEMKKCLYTAVTRASNELHVLL